MLGGGGWLGGFKSHAVPSFPQSLVLLFLLINLKEPVFMKLCLSSSSTSLMCNAHVVRHVNNAPHRVILPLLCFTSISSNRWTPMFVNGGFMASFLNWGRSRIKGSKFFAFLRLQKEQLRTIFFVSDLNLTTQSFFLSIKSTYSLPLFPRLCVFLTMG